MHFVPTIPRSIFLFFGVVIVSAALFNQPVFLPSVRLCFLFTLFC